MHDPRDDVDPEANEPMNYDSFRTRLTYGEVYHLIFNRRWKRRNGVLGAWHEIKKKMYREYVAAFWEVKEEMMHHHGAKRT